MYLLYVDKPNKVIKVKKAAKVFHNLEFTADVQDYNGTIWFSSNRKKLTAYGRNIKAKWIEEAKMDLDCYEKIKI